MKLIERKPNRLFTFGCSFTKYLWSSWPNIIAFDLDIPLWNYGKSGAGNQYIFNALMQADNYYQFNKDDLIMVCWTNIMREDRRYEKWITPGSIFSQKYYPDDFIKKYINTTYCSLRDFAVIKASYEFLLARKCQFHFLKMINFERLCQYDWYKDDLNLAVLEQYQKYLDIIKPSFYDVLWNGDWKNKIQNNELIFKKDSHAREWECHPTIQENFQYLEAVFTEHNFSQNTVQIVQDRHTEFVETAKLLDKIQDITKYKISIKPSEEIKLI